MLLGGRGGSHTSFSKLKEYVGSSVPRDGAGTTPDHQLGERLLRELPDLRPAPPRRWVFASAVQTHINSRQPHPLGVAERGRPRTGVKSTKADS